jgi:hypothetical protein
MEAPVEELNGVAGAGGGPGQRREAALALAASSTCKQLKLLRIKYHMHARTHARTHASTHAHARTRTHTGALPLMALVSATSRTCRPGS